MPARRLAFVFLASLAGGCATLSEEECRLADWYGIGLTDGSEGRTLARFEEYRRDCAKAGIAPDARAYAAGRDDGLARFCRPERGYAFALDGGRYAGVCPREAEPGFRAAYERGRAVFSLTAAADDARRDARSAESRIRRTRDDRAEIEAAIAAEGDASRRAALAAELREKSELIGRLEAEIDDFEDRARDADFRADALRAEHRAAFGY